MHRFFLHFFLCPFVLFGSLGSINIYKTPNFPVNQRIRIATPYARDIRKSFDATKPLMVSKVCIRCAVRNRLRIKTLRF